MKKIALVLFFSVFIGLAYADTLYLKNGRKITGVVKSENDRVVELEVCRGIVKFNKSEIEKIERAAAEEVEVMRMKWEESAAASQERIVQQQEKIEKAPRRVDFSREGRGITLDVLLNKKIEASLVLDTGASVVVLRKGMAGKLGIDLDKVRPDAKLTVADGRQVDAKHIILKSVKVQGVEAENVDAALMMEEVGDVSFADGLLGMSFLSRFNFKIDNQEKELVLEKL
ncbi:MAG: retropepsin-like aspartic protease [Candidatus Omnitrophica bacterium]|nr:retropepsin-like aspartic protease [Candidatus Omnitrophota bacterium]